MIKSYKLKLYPNKVNPAYSSQTCPMCGFIDKANRQGTSFLCGKCGYGNHADVVGAINLVGRVAREPSVPLKSIREEIRGD
jgi:putative transposase